MIVIQNLNRRMEEPVYKSPYQEYIYAEVQPDHHDQRRCDTSINREVIGIRKICSVRCSVVRIIIVYVWLGDDVRLFSTKAHGHARPPTGYAENGHTAEKLWSRKT